MDTVGWIADTPPPVGGRGGASSKLCRYLPLAPLLRFDPHGGEDHVLPCRARLITPTAGNLRPRLRVCALPFQDLPRGGKHGAGAYA